jgi:rhamnosyltransferase
MIEKRVCAIIITFRPRADVLENLRKVRRQVQGLVLIDNGSSAEMLEPFHAAQQILDLTLIENRVNLGIAAALNAGVQRAKAQGFQYVALFDQDSTVTGGFIHAMLTEYESHPRRDRIAIVTPSQVDRNSGRTRTHGCAKDGGPLVAITSGSLMPIEIFDECGLFEEDLIIDCVDHEYCLRVRSQGYTLAQCRQAVLLVAVGSVRSHQAFGLKINATHHSAKRRYYMTRNRLVMFKRFWKQQPGWCYRTLRDIVQDTIKVALFEEDRWSKLKNTARGIHDALHGRMGRVVEL